MCDSSETSGFHLLQDVRIYPITSAWPKSVLYLFNISPHSERFVRLVRAAEIMLLLVGSSCRTSVIQHHTSFAAKMKTCEFKLSLNNTVNMGEWVYTVWVMSVLVTVGVCLATFVVLSASCFILS